MQLLLFKLDYKAAKRCKPKVKTLLQSNDEFISPSVQPSCLLVSSRSSVLRPISSARIRVMFSSWRPTKEWFLRTVRAGLIQGDVSPAPLHSLSHTYVIRCLLFVVLKLPCFSNLLRCRSLPKHGLQLQVSIWYVTHNTIMKNRVLYLFLRIFSESLYDFIRSAL